jgi:hypothetical protein
MILRAIFWIGLVALLMPHEPDLGLGRAAAPGQALMSGVSSAFRHNTSCEGQEVACTAAVGLLERLKISSARSLAEVRSEIDQAERARGTHGG